MSFLSAIGNYFKGIGGAFVGQLGNLIKDFLSKFLVQDVGKLAVAAAQAAEAELPGAASADKKAAAIANLKVALSDAGHDLATFSESLLNFLIEAAVQVITAAAASAAVTVVASQI